MAAIVPANCVMLPVSPGEQKKTVHTTTPAAASADTLILTGFGFVLTGIDSVTVWDTTSVPNAQVPCTWVTATNVLTIDPAGALAATVFSIEVTGDAQ